jgi:hypothetical protein
MKRRILLKWLVSGAATLPLARVTRGDLSAVALAKADELSAGHVFVLRDVATTVLPSAIGVKGQDEAVDNFLRWLRDYKEGVPLSHGYGEPRLVRTGPSPAPGYGTQINALQQAATERGGRFGALPLDARRAILDVAFRSAGVQNLPARPDGKHIVVDLMAHYFRSSAANDLCYNARIGRHTFRAIPVTTVRPEPLRPQAPSPKAQVL